MTSFTLDTNCIIDVDEGRPAAAHIIALAQAQQRGGADVALVAVSASERQAGDRYLDNYADFSQRVARLGLGHLPVLPTIAYFNIGFYDVGLWADQAMVDRERAIHAVLSPTSHSDGRTSRRPLGSTLKRSTSRRRGDGATRCVTGKCFGRTIEMCVTCSYQVIATSAA